MAKTNMIEREKKRAALAKKHAAKRAKLKALIKDPKVAPEEREAAAAHYAAVVSYQHPDRDS